MRLKIAILFVAGMTVAGLAYSQQGQRVIAGKMHLIQSHTKRHLDRFITQIQNEY